jgi:DNA-binding transcriptional ArsR family regulator
MADNLREEVVRMHAELCSGISDPNRILIIYNLAESPKCVNDLANSLDLSQPSVSRHLKIMRDCGIVRALRDGQSVIYSLADRRIIEALDILRKVLADSINDQAALVQEVNPIQPSRRNA